MGKHILHSCARLQQFNRTNHTEVKHTYTAQIIYIAEHDLPLKYSVDFMQTTRPKVETNNNVIIWIFYG